MADATGTACVRCGDYIWRKEDGVRLLDQNFHRPCLVEALAEINIHVELANMGLDMPPRLPAA